MAGDQQSSQEKTEDPTPRRLRDARKKGQVSKSQDLNTVSVLIAAFMAIGFMIPTISKELQDLMHTFFSNLGRADFTVEEMFLAGRISFMVLIRVSAPYILAVFLTAAMIGYLQVGPVFSAEPLKPQMKRLNVIEGIKNWFKLKTFVELFKHILKVILLFTLAYFTIKGILSDFLMTVTISLQDSAKFTGHVVITFFFRVIVLFLGIAILDVIFQRREYKKQLRMTKEEVKREYKEDEGDPLIKSVRRQQYMEMIMGDARQQVAKSDVVVTNPTAVAVAVAYDKEEMLAPQVMVKGQRLYAQFIRELAEELGVPIVRNVPLAWALLELEMGDEIPEDLYQAVAEVLVFVYKLKEEKEKGT